MVWLALSRIPVQSGKLKISLHSLRGIREAEPGLYSVGVIYIVKPKKDAESRGDGIVHSEQQIRPASGNFLVNSRSESARQPKPVSSTFQRVLGRQVSKQLALAFVAVNPFPKPFEFEIFLFAKAIDQVCLGLLSTLFAICL